jgi:hypothetical protein
MEMDDDDIKTMKLTQRALDSVVSLINGEIKTMPKAHVAALHDFLQALCQMRDHPLLDAWAYGRKRRAFEPFERMIEEAEARATASRR